MAVNTHKIFVGTAADDGYVDVLDIDDVEEAELREARDAIRQRLKAKFAEWPTLLRKSLLFEDEVQEGDMPALKPKFRMQGSFAYRTLNDPAQTPPQEIDLDDGMFLPTSYLKAANGSRPSVNSDGYFLAVETALEPLCRQKGWELATHKPSCVRVVLSDNAHIDLALYAIPDVEFVALVEKSLAKAMDSAEILSLTEGVEFSEPTYEALREDQIMLAHREQGWKPSDPRKLEDWFREALDRHGEQLRRVCRYLKGWRDNTWSGSKLSSIALMACAVQAFDQTTSAVPANRDDKALLMVAERLPGLLAGRIGNPVVDGQHLDEGWDQADRLGFVSAAQVLVSALRAAAQSSDPAFAISKLQEGLGDRVPDDLSLVIVEAPDDKRSDHTAPAVLTHGMLKDVGSEPAVRDAVKKDGDHRYG